MTLAEEFTIPADMNLTLKLKVNGVVAEYPTDNLPSNIEVVK